MFGHFAEVAPQYRSLRTTDEAPVRFIQLALQGRAAIDGADIGCGAGRYDRLLFQFRPNLHLKCIDINPRMLVELSRYLAAESLDNFETLAAGIEDLDLPDSSLDAVFTFNAVHHFDFPTFLEKAGRALRGDGQIFVYTRTPEHNAESVWGRFFPGFCDKETRLYRLSDMQRWVGEAAGLTLVAAMTFSYPRVASLARLLAQARAKHYSTFELYKPDEFAVACRTFERKVRHHYSDPERVAWHDQNVMLQIARTP